MEWHRLSGLVVPTPTWCHAQAYRAAGSDRLVSWRRAPRGDVGQMAEATEEELERRACNGKSGKSQIWAPTSELGR
ncbi:unnamed protein product [Prunus armeniaca]